MLFEMKDGERGPGQRCAGRFGLDQSQIVTRNKGQYIENLPHIV